MREHACHCDNEFCNQDNSIKLLQQNLSACEAKLSQCETRLARYEEALKVLSKGNRSPGVLAIAKSALEKAKGEVGK